eukprot:gb/GEZN01001072.1/.p1 GENE.gb/GEZN01001072.1/~~gb/GEZN01001072.1/.p1  ORF type:complete len:1055 (+),score=200.94 gb/GEZN01001072.1/:94-3258(+)
MKRAGPLQLVFSALWLALYISTTAAQCFPGSKYNATIDACVPIPCTASGYNGTAGKCVCAPGYGPGPVSYNSSGIWGCYKTCALHPTNNPCRSQDNLALCKDSSKDDPQPYSCRCSAGFQNRSVGGDATCEPKSCQSDTDDGNPCNTHDKSSGCVVRDSKGRYECVCNTGYANSEGPGMGTCESIAVPPDCSMNSFFASVLLYSIPILAVPSVFIYVYNLKKFPKSESFCVVHVGLALFDLLGDICFVSSIAPSNPCAPASDVIRALFYPAIVFLVLPLVINFTLVLREYCRLAQSNPAFQRWQMENETGSLLFLVLGFLDTALCLLVGSKIFDAEIFSAPLPFIVENQLKFYGTIKTLFEDVPQLIIQGISVLSSKQSDQSNQSLIAQLSLLSSCLAIVVGLMHQCVILAMKQFPLSNDPHATREQLQEAAAREAQGIPAPKEKRFTIRKFLPRYSAGISNASRGLNAADNLRAKLDAIKEEKKKKEEADNQNLIGGTHQKTSSKIDININGGVQVQTKKAEDAAASAAILKARLEQHRLKVADSKSPPKRSSMFEKVTSAADQLKMRMQQMKEKKKAEDSPSPKQAPSPRHDAAEDVVRRLQHKMQLIEEGKRMAQHQHHSQESESSQAVNQLVNRLAEMKQQNGHYSPQSSPHVTSSTQPSYNNTSPHSSSHIRNYNNNNNSNNSPHSTSGFAEFSQQQQQQQQQHHSPRSNNVQQQQQQHSPRSNNFQPYPQQNSRSGQYPQQNSPHSNNHYPQQNGSDNNDNHQLSPHSSQKRGWQEDPALNYSPHSSNNFESFTVELNTFSPSASPIDGNPPGLSPPGYFEVIDEGSPRLPVSLSAASSLNPSSRARGPDNGAPSPPSHPPPAVTFEVAPPPFPPPATPGSAPPTLEKSPSQSYHALDQTYKRMTRMIGESIHDHSDDDDDDDTQSAFQKQPARFDQRQLAVTHEELSRCIEKERKMKAALEDDVYRAMRSRGAIPEKLHTWDVLGVTEFLIHFVPEGDIGEVRQNCLDFGMNGAMLKEMTHESLHELGVNSALTRAKILAKLHQMTE